MKYSGLLIGSEKGFNQEGFSSLILGKHRIKDSDMDFVPDIFDCSPFNRKKDITIPYQLLIQRPSKPPTLAEMQKPLVAVAYPSAEMIESQRQEIIARIQAEQEANLKTIDSQIARLQQNILNFQEGLKTEQTPMGRQSLVDGIRKAEREIDTLKVARNELLAGYTYESVMKRAGKELAEKNLAYSAQPALDYSKIYESSLKAYLSLGMTEEKAQEMAKSWVISKGKEQGVELSFQEPRMEVTTREIPRTVITPSGTYAEYSSGKRVKISEEKIKMPESVALIKKSEIEGYNLVRPEDIRYPFSIPTYVKKGEESKAMYHTPSLSMPYTIPERKVYVPQMVTVGGPPTYITPELKMDIIEDIASLKEIPSEAGSFVSQIIGKTNILPYTIPERKVYVPQMVTVGGPPTYIVPEEKTSVAKEVGKVAGLGTTLGIYATPYVGSFFLGTSVFGGTRQALNPKLTIQERVMGGIEAGIASTFLVMKTDFFKTKIEAQKESLWMKEIRPEYTDIGPKMRTVTIGGKTGTEMFWRTSGKFTGYPIKQTALMKGMPPKWIQVGTETIITKSTPWNRFLDYITISRGGITSPRIIYSGIPYGKVGRAGYKTALKELTETGLTAQQAKSLLRYSLSVPETKIAGIKSLRIFGDVTKLGLGAKADITPAKIPGYPVTGIKKTTQLFKLKAEPTDIFGIEGIKGKAKIEKIFYKGGIPSGKVSEPPKEFLQVAIGKTTTIKGGIKQIYFPEKNLLQVKIELPRTVTKVDTGMQEIFQKPMISESGKILKPGKLGEVTFSPAKVTSYKKLIELPPIEYKMPFSITQKPTYGGGIFKPSDAQIVAQKQVSVTQIPTTKESIKLVKLLKPSVIIPSPKIVETIFSPSVFELSQSLLGGTAITLEKQYPISKQETFQQTKQKEKLKEELKTKVSIAQPQITLTVQEQIPSQITPQLQKIITPQIPELIPQIPELIPPVPPGFPELPKFPPPKKPPRYPEEVLFGIPLERKKVKEEEGYDAYAYIDATKKKKAYWEKLNAIPLTKQAALSRSAEFVDNTISARGKVVKSASRKKPVETGEDYFGVNKYKFRQFQQRKGVRTKLPNQFIELQRYRLDKPGETRKIQSAKVSRFFGF